MTWASPSTLHNGGLSAGVEKRGWTLNKMAVRCAIAPAQATPPRCVVEHTPSLRTVGGQTKRVFVTRLSPCKVLSPSVLP